MTESLGIVWRRNLVCSCVVFFLAASLLFTPAAAPGDSFAAPATTSQTAESAEVISHAPVAVFSPKTLRTARAIFENINDNRWKAARRKAAKLGDPLLETLVQWLDLERDGKQSFEEISAFIGAHPGWPRLRTLIAHAEEAITDATPDTLVLAWFDSHRPITTNGLVRYGEALLREGRDTEGIGIIRRAWIEGNFGYRQERTFISRHHKRWTREDNWTRLDRLLWEGKLKAARRTMRRVDKDLQVLAEARLRLRLNRGGVDWAIRRVPAHLLHDPAFLYERLRWRRRHDRDNAKEILEELPFDLAHLQLWWIERAAVVRQTLAKGNISAAYQLASNHRQIEGASFAEAEWLSGWVALRFLHDNETALNHFTKLYDSVRYPISRSRAAYWAARAAESLGRAELQQGWYAKAVEFPTTFHGQLATARLEGKIPLSLPPDPLPTSQERERFNNIDLVRVVRMLGEIGEYKQIKPFVIHLNDIVTTPGERALVADLAYNNERLDVAVKVARQAIRNGVNLVSRGYPIFTQVDRDHHETPLILALMRQESGFDSYAKSRTGARGLMQIMPATAKSIARKLNVPYSKSRLITDPGYNLMLGHAYISNLLNRYDNSYVLALAAYNAGPKWVKRWRRDNGDPRSHDVDALDWIERIPLAETRNYIQRVLSNLQVYRIRLNTPQAAWSLENDLHYRD